MFKTLKLLIFGCLMTLNVNATNTPVKYGLSFYSSQSPAKQRTTLLLEGGEPIAVGDDFTLSFSMLIRSGEPSFGSILHLVADDGQAIHFAIVVDDGKNVPALVYNDDMSVCHASVVTDKWQNVRLQVNAKKNKVVLFYQGKEYSYTIPLNGTKHLKVLFGRTDGYVSDVAPMIVKDVKVAVDGKDIRCWKLYRHNGANCLDEIGGKLAMTTNPQWIIDNHIQWRKIYHAKHTGVMGVAFDSKVSQFYLVSPGDIITLNNRGKVVKQQKISVGYKANSRSNGFIAFESTSGNVVSFSLRQGLVSRLDLKNARWSMPERNDKSAFYYNHAGVYNHADSSYYFFGGYGYYAYHNDLFRLKAGSDKVERVPYQNPIAPRFGAAMGVADGKLYILGGRGNKVGKQAVESYFYYELWCIDLKTRKASLVWRKNSGQKGWLMATTMFYQPDKKAFYALNMNDNGGTMYQISLSDTIVSEVAKPMRNTKNFQDFEYNMFYSPEDGHFYAVIDKIMADKTHDLSIYQLATPLLSDDEILQSDSDDGGLAKWWAIAIVVLIALVCIFLLYVKKRRAQVTSKLANLQTTPPVHQNTQNMANNEADERVGTQTVSDATKGVDAEMDTCGDAHDDTAEAEEEPQQNLVKHFDRTRAAVSLLGTFSVYDKEGTDITTQFTPRLKDLLLLLILYSEKRKHGVSVDKVTEIIWFDKDESSARNNRNVTLRKLRVLLEKVGNVEIISSNGYLSVKWGKDVFCDYHALLQYVEAYNSGEYEGTDELMARLLEILLYGPLLPGYETEWLDEFKDANSSLSIDMLNKLLNKESDKQNDKLTLCIADIMFLHDPLNEEALSAKCHVLCRQGKMGIAKRTYDRFCKEYKHSMAEDYEVPFADFAK